MRHPVFHFYWSAIGGSAAHVKILLPLSSDGRWNRLLPIPLNHTVLDKFRLAPTAAENQNAGQKADLFRCGACLFRVVCESGVPFSARDFFLAQSWHVLQCSCGLCQRRDVHAKVRRVYSSSNLFSRRVRLTYAMTSRQLLLFFLAVCKECINLRRYQS